ncbi:MAG: tRNA (adenosine(37)-N6)-threonylcarbamoyltransferase complex ATPase subunit type 1 TsaE, partial [Clostridiales bacterium]
QGRLPFSHIDAYRLVDDEAYEAGLEECFNGQNIVLVEWPGNLGSLLPQEAINIELQHSFDEEDQWREIIFNVDQGQYPWLEEAIKCGF